MDITQLEKQLTEDEGKRLKVYLDTKGLPTVGIGHLVTKDDDLSIGDTITEEKCLTLFKQDVDTAIKSCYKLFKDFASQPEEVKQIVVNMCFNLGVTRLAGFKKFIKAIDIKDYQKAALEMMDSKWYKVDVPARAGRLVKRMMAVK